MSYKEFAKKRFLRFLSDAQELLLALGTGAGALIALWFILQGLFVIATPIIITVIVVWVIIIYREEKTEYTLWKQKRQTNSKDETQREEQ